MPRALWTGSLSFGLVNVPVQLVTAVRDLDPHFHLLHKRDLARIDLRRYCEAEDVEIPYDEVAHGHELEDGERKRHGETVWAAPKQDAPGPVPDLMAAPRETLADVRAREREGARVTR